MENGSLILCRIQFERDEARKVESPKIGQRLAKELLDKTGISKSLKDEAHIIITEDSELGELF